MTSFNVQRAASLAAAGSTLALAAPLAAQDTDTNAPTDEAQAPVIVVTAQKREQNLQDVPISITAFTNADIESARLENVNDLGRLVPGLYVSPNPSDSSGALINIRGVGTIDPQIGQDSRVAIYQDGVYLGKTQGLVFDMPDLERVEVLKGPQGTLYGRNTVAGAINLISARPEGEWGGKLAGEYGRFDRLKLSGVLNIPVSETGGLRISGLVSEEDGWVENLGNGTDFGGGSQQALRAVLGGDVTPELRLDLAVDYSKSALQPLFYQALPGTSAPGALFAPAVATSTGRQRQTATSFTNERGDTEQYGISATLGWDFSEDHSLKVIGAFRSVDSSRFAALVPTANPFILSGIVNSDIVPDIVAPGVQSFNSLLAGSALAFQLTGQPLRPDFLTAFNRPLDSQSGLFLSPAGGTATLDGHEQYSLEATLTGEFAEGSLRYTLGAFYYDEFTSNDFTNQGNDFDAFSYLFVAAGFSPQIGAPIINGTLTAGGLAPLQGLLPPAQFQALVDAQLAPIVGDVSAPLNPTTLVSIFGEARQSVDNNLRIDSKAFAIYGELTWNITDALRITGGLRYSDESKDGFGQPKSPFFLDNIDLLGRVIPPNVASIDFDVLNPSMVVEFEPAEDALLYASYKESYRAGGFNAAAIGTRLPGQTFGADFVFGREDIAAYEAGAKLGFGGNRFLLNLAGFYYDITDQQSVVALNPLVSTSRAVVNTDEEVWGFELDAVAYLLPGLSVTASYSWVDGDAGDVTNPLTGVVEVRDEILLAPENSFVAGANFATQLDSEWGLFANATYSYKDDLLLEPQQAIRLTDQNIVSGRIGIDRTLKNGTRLSLWAWGENIFDDKYTIAALGFETFAFRSVVFGQPATYGVTAQVEF